MKKTSLIAVLAVLITACSSVATVLTYSVTFTTENPGRMTDLSLATRHVVERRLARLGGDLIDYDIDFDKESQVATIGLEVDNAKAAKALNKEMVTPFTFEVRYLADEFVEGDIQVEGAGSYRATGITKDDVDWVIGESIEPILDRGRVLIGFTDEGAPKVQKLFEEQAGNTIGLFVRGRLTAAVQIQDTFEKVLVIEGLPSSEIANVFADDMNVGIHMVFTNQ